MRILYFHQHFSTPAGAAGTRSYELARYLIKHGHNVTMVAGSYALGKTGLNGTYKNGRRRGMVDGIDVIEFDLAYSNADTFLKRTLTFLSYSLASVRLTFSEPYDLVFATSTPLTAAIPGIAARLLRSKPFVFEVRDLWPELPRAMGVITNPLVLTMMSFLEWASYRAADRCVALSPGIVEGITRRGISKDRVEFVPNGCDLTIFRGSHEAWRPAALSSRHFLALFSGTHGPANGLDAVLDAAKVLKIRGREDIALVLVGDGKLKRILMDRAEREELSNVIFHEPVDKRRLAGLFAGSDLGLQILANVPAFYDGTSPNKFFDYIAAGLPVLINYPGWIADLIRDNDCGYAVPPDNPAALADALERAADDREALRRKGRNASQLAEREFDRARSAKTWVAWVTDGVRI
jgi:glycosyltransferase involved in cell wall biosynthesis